MLLLEDIGMARAKMFHALGDRTRVEIFDFLRGRCGAVAVSDEGDVRMIDGPTFGEVCCHITGRTKINSTISFHLNELKDSGLIRVEKRGRFMICSINEEAVLALADYLRIPQTDTKAACC